MTGFTLEALPTVPDADAIDETLARMAEAGIRVVDLQFSDITGGAKSLTIPAGMLAQALAHGYRFDGAALTGGVRLLELDLYLVPDPTTLVVYPSPGPTPGTAEPRRARLYCSVHRRDGQPFAGDPRSTLQRTLEAASAAVWLHGRAAEIAGPEMIADDLVAAIPQALSLAR